MSPKSCVKIQQHWTDGPLTFGTERHASGAAGSRSGAEAVSRRLHAMVRRRMCEALRLPLLRCTFPAAGEISGHIHPDPLVSGQRPYLGEMFGLKLLALGWGEL